MRYTQFDDHPVGFDGADRMQGWWADHWAGRQGLAGDLTQEPIWGTISDVLHGPGLVLEAGCGTGRWVQFLERLGHRAVGLDFARSGLRAGKEANTSLWLLQGDCRTMPFPDGTFDYILSLGAVEHDIAGPEAALREFKRILKPGGLLMCSVPCLNVEKTLLLPWFVVRDWLKRRPVLRRLAGKTEPFAFYQYVYSPREYRRLLTRCGFRVDRMRTYGTTTANRYLKPFADRIGRVQPFYNGHMMMALCRRQS